MAFDATLFILYLLASALVKLSGENLGNLQPHTLYACFYSSHPPAVERVNRLKLEAKQENSDG